VHRAANDSLPKKASSWVKIGALATLQSLVSARSPSYAIPVASAIIWYQKIAACGDNAASCFSASS
jgi:hypothetical protein